MKKNRMMRLASILLVCVLLTTSVISGTFAKYTTSTNGEDTARVAKWGVTLSVDTESLFATSYGTNLAPAAKNEAGNDIAITVNAAGTPAPDVVAPGTGGAMVFSIVGEPEVAAKVTVSFTDISSIHVPQGAVVIGPSADDKNAEAYYPIKWTLKRSDTKPTDWENVTEKKLNGVTLAAVAAYFSDETTGINGNYDANTNLEEVFGYYQLSWEWAFENAVTGVNALDTYLGDQSTPQNEAFVLNINVEQIN